MNNKQSLCLWQSSRSAVTQLPRRRASKAYTHTHTPPFFTHKSTTAQLKRDCIRGKPIDLRTLDRSEVILTPYPIQGFMKETKINETKKIKTERKQIIIYLLREKEKKRQVSVGLK